MFAPVSVPCPLSHICTSLSFSVHLCLSRSPREITVSVHVCFSLTFVFLLFSLFCLTVSLPSSLFLCPCLFSPIFFSLFYLSQSHLFLSLSLFLSAWVLPPLHSCLERRSQTQPLHTSTQRLTFWFLPLTPGAASRVGLGIGEDRGPVYLGLNSWVCLQR